LIILGFKCRQNIEIEAASKMDDIRYKDENSAYSYILLCYGMCNMAAAFMCF